MECANKRRLHKFGCIQADLKHPLDDYQGLVVIKKSQFGGDNFDELEPWGERGPLTRGHCAAAVVH